MKKFLLCGVLLIAGSHASRAQFSGSGGSFAGSGSAFGGSAGSAGTAGTYADTGGSPAVRESNKRRTTNAEARDDGSSTFIEASMLMNVKADEYVAVFGVTEEGKTPQEAGDKMDATIVGFKGAAKALGISENDVFVDFVVQNRIYGYSLQDFALLDKKILKEDLTGFELKKNVSLHFKDKSLVDKLAVEAARFQIFDLIKVDYVVKARDAIQAQLQAQTYALLKRKAAQYQTQLGVQFSAQTQLLADKPSVYFPIDQYSSFVASTASETENIEQFYDSNTVRYPIQKARKSRTIYFNPLNGDGFDAVINPVIIEPVVQFTTYVKVKYETNKKGKKPKVARGFGGFGNTGNF